MKYFFISFAHTKGFGNAYVNAPNGILSLRNIAKNIAEKHFFQGVVVLNFIEITKEQYEDKDN